MIHALLCVLGVLFGLFTWGSFELAGEKLRGRPDLAGSPAWYRAFGSLFLVLCVVCWRLA